MLKLYYLAVKAYRSKMAKKNTKFSSEPACEGAVPPKRINAEGSDSILADLDVPKSFMSPRHPDFFVTLTQLRWLQSAMLQRRLHYLIRLPAGSWYNIALIQ